MSQVSCRIVAHLKAQSRDNLHLTRGLEYLGEFIEAASAHRHQCSSFRDCPQRRLVLEASEPLRADFGVDADDLAELMEELEGGQQQAAEVIRLAFGTEPERPAC